jgi:hypothetical protein
MNKAKIVEILKTLKRYSATEERIMDCVKMRRSTHLSLSSQTVTKRQRHSENSSRKWQGNLQRKRNAS